MAITVAKLQAVAGIDTRGVEQGEKQVSGALGRMKSAFGDVGKIAGGILGAQVVGKIIGGAKQFAASIISSAADAETKEKQLDAVLASTGAAAAKRAAEYASASKQMVTSTALSGDELGKLNGKLTKATARLHDMERAYAKAKNPTESQTLALEEQRKTVAGLTGEIEQGSVKSTTTLANAMGLLPPVAQMTKKELLGLADSLSQVTPVEDDAIVAAESMLLTFTNIGKDVFPQTTETLLDMATAMNSGAAPSAEQLSAQAIQLGKALNDPIKGITALTRVGVTFTEAQKDQIAGMVKAGDVAGAQKLILAELATEFGGSAKAAGETFAGSMTILNNQMGNVKETIGGFLLPYLTKLAGKAIPLVTQSIGWLQGKLPQVEGAVKTFVGGATREFNLLKGAIEAQGATGAAFRILDWIGVPENAQTVLAPKLGKLADDVATTAKTAFDKLKSGDVPGYISTILKGMIQVKGDIGDIFATVRGQIQTKLTELLASLAQSDPALGNPLQTIFAGMTAEGGPDWATIVGGMGDLGSVLYERFAPQVKQAWLDIWAEAKKTPIPFTDINLGDAISGIVTALQPFKDNVLAYLTPAFEAIKNGIGPIRDALGPVGEAFTQLGAAIAPLLPVIGYLVGGALVALAGIISGVLTGGVGLLRGAIEAIGGVVTFATGQLQMLGGVIDLIVGVISGDTEKINAAWDKIKEGFATAWEGLKTTISGLLSGLGAFLMGFISGAVDSVVGLVTGETSKVGTEFVNGLLKGLSDAWGKVTSWLSEKAAGLPQWIKGPLGIKSPSRVMAEVGRNITGGLVQGVDSGGSSIADALMQVSEYFMRFAQSTDEATAKRMKSVASAFKDMSKGVDELVGSIAKLQQMQPPGAGATNADMFGAWLDQFLVLAEMAMTRIDQVIEAFGYNRIKKLKHTAGRLRSIIESVMVDLSGMTERKLPPLDVWFGQLHEVFNHAAGFVAGIRAKYSNRMLDDMAAAAASVAAIYVVIDQDLEKIKPRTDPGWREAFALTIEQLTSLAAMLVGWLGGFSQSVRNMIANAAEVATNVKELWGVFFDLNSIKPYTGEGTFDSAIVYYVDQLSLALMFVSGWLGNLSAEAVELVKKAAEIAEPVSKVLAILGVNLAEMVPPAPNFPVLFGAFLAALALGAAMMIPWLRDLRKEFGGEVLAEAALTGEALKSVMDVLTLGQVFADLGKLTIGDNIGTLTTKILAALTKATAVLVPGLQTIQTRWGEALDAVKGIAALMKQVIGDTSDAYKSLSDFVAAPDVSLQALQAKLNKLNQANMMIAATPPTPAPTTAPTTGGGAGGATSEEAPAQGADLVEAIKQAVIEGIQGSVIELKIKNADGSHQTVSARLGGLTQALVDMGVQGSAQGAFG
ncbi:MAG: tail tape measure protein [Phage 5P_3]|nr:MAG: tail tape measure protein [Phage 5P_3]